MRNFDNLETLISFGIIYKLHKSREVWSIIFLLGCLISAAYWDLRTYKVPNQIIIVGLGTSLILQVLAIGIHGIYWWGKCLMTPFVLLFLLYLFHVIGAGDIKLFSVVGGFLGSSKVIHIIILAFIIGAVMSLIQIISFHNFKYRIQYLTNYIHTIRKKKRITPYYNREKGSTKEVIPFSLAIMISVFVTLIMKVQ